MVTQRAQRTPIDAILRSSTQHAAGVVALDDAALDVERCQGADHHLLEVGNVAVQVLAAVVQVEHRVADQPARGRGRWSGRRD